MIDRNVRPPVPPAPSTEQLARLKQYREASSSLKQIESLTGMAAEATRGALATLREQMASLAETAEERLIRETYEVYGVRLGMNRNKAAAAKRERKRSGRVRRLVALTLNRQFVMLADEEKAYWERIEGFLTDPTTHVKDIGTGLNRAVMLHKIGLGKLEQAGWSNSRQLRPNGADEMAYLRLNEATRIALARAHFMHGAFRIGRGH